MRLPSCYLIVVLPGIISIYTCDCKFWKIGTIEKFGLNWELELGLKMHNRILSNTVFPRFW